MRAIMLMFDSLNRRMLQSYGCDLIHTPNFTRLAQRTVVFEKCYVGSTPCMPARRELHTGRYNFLHRSWGPIEPFDDSMPEILKTHGIYTHLVSDHYHYWEDGGCDYHTRYSTWRCSRGQEGDPWQAKLGVDVPEVNNHAVMSSRNRDLVNRTYLRQEQDWPQAKTFAMGEQFLHDNHDQDNWFLTIETFDPHEPFFAPEKYRQLYPHEYDESMGDWPVYGPVHEEENTVQHIRMEYAALVSMCDAYLGKVLDLMDRYGLWKDTMLIVNTDHGFLLSEHGYWAKCCMPWYNELANIPLFIYDPRCPEASGQRRSALVQTIDLPATLLEYFNVPVPNDMQGRPLRDTLREDTPVREAALYGIHGGHVNITDGRYVYMRAPAGDNAPLYQYTLMPTHMRGLFSLEDLRTAELAEPFSFTKGLRTLKIRPADRPPMHEFQTMLFDTQSDPNTERTLNGSKAEARMIDLLTKHMKLSDAPLEQYERLGLEL